jgi:hypothetical protein
MKKALLLAMGHLTLGEIDKSLRESFDRAAGG